MRLSLSLKSILLVGLTSLVLTACGDKKDGDDNHNEEDYWDSEFQLTPFAKCSTTLSETFKDSLLEQTNYVGVSNLGGTIITSDSSAEDLLLKEYPLKFKLNSATAFTTSIHQYLPYELNTSIEDALEKVKNQYIQEESMKQSTENNNEGDVKNNNQDSASNTNFYEQIPGPKHVLIFNFETTNANRCIISVLDYKAYNPAPSIEYYNTDSGESTLIKISYDKSSVILE